MQKSLFRLFIVTGLIFITFSFLALDGFQKTVIAMNKKNVVNS